MVVFAGDMNGHVGSSNVGYDCTHGGFGYRDMNADGSMILEFARWAKLSHLQHIVREAGTQLVTYAAGLVKSMVDYIIVR